jgi:competence protein ComEC
MLATGSAIGALGTALTTVEPPSWMPPILIVFGLLAAGLALRWRRRGRSAELWLLAGLALVCGRGLFEVGGNLQLQRLIVDGEATIRARAVIVEGWTPSRWGQRTRVTILTAGRQTQGIELPRRCRLEVRGTTRANGLPEPGSVVEILVRIRGTHRSPLLVAASPRLVIDEGDRRLYPLVRNQLAEALFRAAGTDVDRIRAAEVAAALALGRRDLVPQERRDRWRRSGLAHVLAVSGLHVGLVAGAVWLFLALAGAKPNTTRLAVLVLVPAYALLAGAAPSAVRAALMVCIYLVARLLGRALLPMAAVLLAATLLLMAEPSLIVNAGFQLTVVITAALVRWVPALTEALVGPKWLTGSLAVPVVAQLAAAPLVAFHFRTFIPGAILANVFVLPLLVPVILGSVGAVVIAPVWRWMAAVGLDGLGLLLGLLQWLSTPARAVELITPPAPLAVAIFCAIVGWIALQHQRWAQWGVLAWVGTLMIAGLWWINPGSPAGPSVELLPVSDGAAVLVRAGSDAALIDAGRYRREAAEMIAGTSRRLRAVMTSHTDEDHIGGVIQILRSYDVIHLILPAWMTSEPPAMPLLRAARRSGTRIVPVASGSALDLGSFRIEVLWPQARKPPRLENERSLVARVVCAQGTVLATADIGRSTELRIARSGFLQSDVLLVAHHGSRGSTGSSFLDQVAPTVALIPAAPGNSHGHPSPEVLDRLEARGIPYRYPARDGRCGARWDGTRWVPFP